jgi:hypothetical protein
MSTERNEAFIAKESATINIIFGLFFIVLLAIAVSTNASLISSTKSLNYVILAIAVTAIFFLTKAFRQKVVFTFTEEGILYYKNLITSWQNFQSAYITALETTGHAPDKFILIIYYFNPDTNSIFKIELPIPISLDASHQTMMNAIERFVGSGDREVIKKKIVQKNRCLIYLLFYFDKNVLT